MAYIRLQRVSKWFQNNDTTSLVVDRVSFDVAKGEFLSILGPSGCGKSTVLQILAGLVDASDGKALIADREVVGPPREAIYVFQQYTRSLLPWRNVVDNVSLAIEHRAGISRKEVVERSMRFLKLVGLEAHARKFPAQLSGGMQQRVTIARALAAEPSVLLMDEPFSAVDALTRVNLQLLLLNVWESTGVTIVFVTHDVEEAVFLSDRIVRMSPGPGSIAEIVDVDIPRPRRQIETPEHPRFLELRRHLLDQLLMTDAELV